MVFRWTAIYDDDIELKQFEGDKENLFGDIVQDKLIAFRIDNGDKHIIVDLKVGIFMINNTIIEIPESSYRPEEYRLIYFRRTSFSIGTSNDSSGKTIESFVGFQITINNQNKKIMFSEKNGMIRLHTK